MAEREVMGSIPGWTTYQGLKLTDKIMLGVHYKLVSIQMITSLGGDIKPLPFPPILLHAKLVGNVKEPTSLFGKSRGHRPRCCGTSCFTCIHWLGGGVRSYMG